jgi:hypothetical protein
MNDDSDSSLLRGVCSGDMTAYFIGTVSTKGQPITRKSALHLSEASTYNVEYGVMRAHHHQIDTTSPGRLE